MTEVKIFIDNEDIVGNIPLHEHILRYLLHHNIKGATLFGGLMGFGTHHHLHEPKRIGATDPVPVMIIFVDEDDKIQAVLPHLKSVVSEGLIVINKVEPI